VYGGTPSIHGGTVRSTAPERSVEGTVRSGTGTVRSGLSAVVGEKNNYENERRSRDGDNMAAVESRDAPPGSDDTRGDVGYDYRTYKNSNYESVS